MRKNAFTLVELLAVLVILAVILVIAVPRVMSVIEDSKKATLESTAKMIASSAEKQKVQNTVLGNTNEITCDSVAKINKGDYANCSIEFDNNTAKVTIEGSGKFDGLWVCGATKTSATAAEEECLSNTGVNTILALWANDRLCSENNLLKDSDNNVRYYGVAPNNYIEFNDEVWRIIGVFNVRSEEEGKIEQRIKIVKDEVLDFYLQYSDRNWNSILIPFLNGKEFEKCYLNVYIEYDDYYNTLNLKAKNQIESALWNTDAINKYYEATAEMVYNDEKSSNEVNTIGLISASDYAFAGGDVCVDISKNTCGDSNWLKTSFEYYTITKGLRIEPSGHLLITESKYGKIYYVTGNSYNPDEWESHVRPAVYLKSSIKLTGTGENTNDGIYKIS